MEASLHLGVLSIFYNIWSSKDTVAFSILVYILQMGDDRCMSGTCSVFTLYCLPDPLSLLSQPAWSKDRWKDYYTTMVRVHHERNLREKATTTSKMVKCEPILHNLLTTRQVEQARPQTKLLCGDYLTLDRLVQDRQCGDPTYKLLILRYIRLYTLN